MKSKIVKELTIKGYDCVILENTPPLIGEFSTPYLTAYVFIPKYDDYPCGCSWEEQSDLEKWMWMDMPYCTWCNKAVFDCLENTKFYNKFCIGLDMNHAWNYDLQNHLDEDEVIRQLNEMVNFYEEHKDEIPED
ncbi:MAG: hypothetical protein ACI4M9_03960 [Succinivibrio sp.]